jgi:hypothetical protein
LDNVHHTSKARGFCLPALGHGTAVAGIIAAVAPGASFLPVTVLDRDGWGNAVAVTARRRWLARHLETLATRYAAPS